MQYFILIVGLVLIYLSLRKTPKKLKSEKIKEFDDIIEDSTFDDESADSFYEREILKSYIELEDKVNNLEEKISSLEEKLKEKDKEFNIFYESSKKEIKFSSENEIIENDDIKDVTETKIEVEDIKKVIEPENEDVIDYVKSEFENYTDSVKDIKETEENTDLENKKNQDIEKTQVEVENEMKNKKILSLYNEGSSVEEIASTLKIGKGEVLLRIGLQKQRK